MSEVTPQTPETDACELCANGSAVDANGWHPNPYTSNGYIRCKHPAPGAPIPMLLWCPGCGDRHIDVGEFATKVHHTHACQSCGMVWRPAVLATVGVQWLPGFKNER